MTFICVLKLYGIVNILKQTAESDQEANKVYLGPPKHIPLKCRHKQDIWDTTHVCYEEPFLVRAQ